ncbi:endonuclease [Jannaschia sp. M317]|uniref:endonuclease n=1 Tax=Jannaschia sp. M317 TaxID=2867011 RepID=UPI0038FD2D48
MDTRIRPIGPLESAATSWGVAALVGAGTFVLLIMIAGWSVLQAIFGGFVVFAVLGLILMLTVGRAPSADAAPQSETISVSARPAVDLETLRPRNVNKPSPHKSSVEVSAISDTTSGERFAGAMARPVSVGVIDAPVAPSQAAAPVDAAPAPPAPAADPGAGQKPATLSAARDGGADDLKKIKGVGPKLETMLHGMGFYHFDQVAAWTDAEIAWVDQNLEGFKGRVSRDEWVSQARVLADGEETAFSQKVGKGDVY